MGKAEDEPALQKGGADDCSGGPVKNRGCTDILCCLFFAAHWVVFIMLFGIALNDGDPARLTSHRDSKGAYCGQKNNWNPWNDDKNGPRFDMTGYEKIAYTMNMEGFFEMVGIDTQICQQANPAVVGAILTTLDLAGSSVSFSSNDYKKAYEDANCAVIMVGGAAAGSLSKMTDPEELKKQAVDMFAGGGIMDKMKKYFYESCVSSCADLQAFAATTTGITSLVGLEAGKRIFVYTPKADSNLYPMYRMLNELYARYPATMIPTVPIMNLMVSPALPASICPEDPQYCVPFPGLEYDDIANVCLFSLGADMPDVGGAVSGAMENSAAGEVVADFGTMVGDIAVAYPAILLMAFLALVIGFLFMVFLRFAVGYIVWGSIFLQFALVAGAAGYFYMMSQCTEKTIETSEMDLGSPAAAPAAGSSTPAGNSTASGNSTRVLLEMGENGEPVDNYVNRDLLVGSAAVALRSLAIKTKIMEECEEPDEGMRDMYLYLSYFFAGLTVLFLLWVLCMCNRIKLGVAINKVAATFVYQNKGIIFVPVVQLLVAMIWWAIWAVAALHLVSQVSDDSLPQGPFSKDQALGTAVDPGQCNGKWPAGDAYVDNELIGTMDANQYYRSATVTDTKCTGIDQGRECYRCTLPRFAINAQFAYAFFSLLWNNALLVAIGQCTIAGAVGYWYFTPNEEKGSRASIRPALTNCFRYHLGSLCFGAFILAVVQFIKWCLYYIQKQAEQQKNFVLVKIAKILQCCVECFERFIKFLNKNAYIQIALLGKNFCRSAWNGFCLILRNAARIAALAMIGSMVKYIGLVFITGGTTVIGYFILMAMYGKEISSPAMPMIIFFMIGYLCGSLFMNVFAMGVDATLQCFVADEELNKEGGSGCTPEELKAFLKNSKGGCC